MPNWNSAIKKIDIDDVASINVKHHSELFISEVDNPMSAIVLVIDSRLLLNASSGLDPASINSIKLFEQVELNIANASDSII